MSVHAGLAAISWVDAPLLVALPLLALASGLCAASETALFSLTHGDRVRLRKVSPRADRLVAALLVRPRRLLLGILLLTNAANVTYFVASAVLERRAGGQALGLALNVGLLVMLVLVADLVPKLLARRQRVRAARLLARPLSLAMRVLGPTCGAVESWVVGPLLRLVRPSRPAPAVDARELEAVLELSVRSGEIREDEQRLLADVVELGMLRVRDVMTPRTAMQWVDAKARAEETREVVARGRRERLPVFSGSLDGPPMGFLNVRGWVAAFAAGRAEAAGPGLSRLIEPAVFVPERTRLDRAFDLLRSKDVRTAMVVDEFGGVVGVLALSDLVKQVATPARALDMSIGLRESDAGIVRVREGVWSVPGRFPLRALGEFLGLGRGIRGEASTVAGLVLARLGRLPVEGDRVLVGRLELTVTGIDGRIVERVELRVTSEEEVAARA